MKKKLIEIIRCPNCHERFEIKNATFKNDEIFTAMLVCLGCGSEFPVVRYIPRLVPNYNYSESWGKLWNETYRLVKDSCTRVPFYYNCIHGRYLEDGKEKEGTSPFGFEWPTNMSGETILEIGPGTGCCTEHLVKTGAVLFSVDMSDAVDSFSEKLLLEPNIHVIQGNIGESILQTKYFDRIWLFQVLQHTPSPPDTLRTMYALLKNEGELAFTSYRGSYNPWYYRLIRKIDPNVSWRYINKCVPFFVPVKYNLQKICYKLKMPLIAKIVRKIMEPIDTRNMYFNTLEGNADQYTHGMLWNRTKNKDLLIQQVILNTFDAITPTYTNNANHDVIEKWARLSGFKDIITWGKSGVRARAFKNRIDKSL